jgi:hypothetical protein
VLCRPVPSMSTPIPRSSGHVAEMALIGSIPAIVDEAESDSFFDNVSVTALSPLVEADRPARAARHGLGVYRVDGDISSFARMTLCGVVGRVV